MSGQEVRLHLPRPPGRCVPDPVKLAAATFYPNPALETRLQVSHAATTASHFEFPTGIPDLLILKAARF